MSDNKSIDDLEFVCQHKSGECLYVDVFSGEYVFYRGRKNIGIIKLNNDEAKELYLNGVTLTGNLYHSLGSRLGWSKKSA